jgi:hypothetical protein
MIDFSDMSVHSLVGGLVNAGSHGIDENAPEITLMESVLRRKVIEEEGVGVIAVPRYGNGSITVDIDIDMENRKQNYDGSIEADHLLNQLEIMKKVPPGRYFLVPAEKA